MKVGIQPWAAKDPAAPQRSRLLLRRDVGPRCAVRRGSQLNGWPRLRRGTASGCAYIAPPRRVASGLALATGTHPDGRIPGTQAMTHCCAAAPAALRLRRQQHKTGKE
jgi:hypothetical protein